MVSELDCWMEWIENQMAEEMYETPALDDLDDFIGGMILILCCYHLLHIFNLDLERF